MSLRPLIAICGTTGVGKSKLAIELALALSQSSQIYNGARIINADAMQVYAGMDIITNKVPPEEQADIDHLLMGFKKPGEQYVVGQWVKDAIHIIDETHRRNQVPIVVGGTSYWIQHLIFPNRLASLDRIDDKDKDEQSPALMSELLAAVVSNLSPKSRELYDNLPKQLPSDATDPESASALYTLLSSLDPQMAQRWHWKDSRKVLRSLNIIKETGKLGSELVSEQDQLNEPPRYRSLLFWLYSKPEALFPRLDIRVDDMIERGLLREVQELIDLAASPATEQKHHCQTVEFDYTLGLYQSIGFKEFSQYLSMPSSPEKEKAYDAAVERMKLSTRQYAKKQVSWLRNKLLPAAYSANAGGRTTGSLPMIPVYLLDATDLSAWKAKIQDVAERITHDFLAERNLPDPQSISEVAASLLALPKKDVSPSAVLNARRKIVCHICTVNPDQPIMIEEGKEWTVHVGTRFHRKMQRRAEHGHEWEARKRDREASKERERELIKHARLQKLNQREEDTLDLLASTNIIE